MAKRMTILQKVKTLYPDMDERYALLALYYGKGSSRAAAEILECHWTGINKLVNEIEKYLTFNKRNGL